MLALLVSPVTCCALSPLHFSRAGAAAEQHQAQLSQVSSGRGCKQESVPMGQPAESPTAAFQEQRPSPRGAAGAGRQASCPLSVLVQAGTACRDLLLGLANKWHLPFSSIQSLKHGKGCCSGRRNAQMSHSPHRCTEHSSFKL